jgi:hypothetical protein
VFPAAALVAGLAGAALGPRVQPRARRAAMQLGVASLWGSVAVAVIVWPGVPPAVAGFAIAGAALLCCMALPFVIRLYAEVPLGSNILSDIPPEDRRAPIGGVLRLAVLFAGAAVGMGSWIPWSTAGIAGSLAAGGALLVVADPRAGPGRKILALVYAGLPAVVALWIRFVEA